MTCWIVVLSVLLLLAPDPVEAGTRQVSLTGVHAELRCVDCMVMMSKPLQNRHRRLPVHQAVPAVIRAMTGFSIRP